MKTIESSAAAFARQFGGEMTDYLPLHTWFEEPKTWTDDVSHYMFRHHTQGIFEAEKRFGYVIKTSNGKDIPTRLLCEKIISSELGFIPSAHQIIQFMDADLWMGHNDRNFKQLLKTPTSQGVLGDDVTKQNLT